MNATATAQQLNILPVDYSYRMPVELFGTFDTTTGKRTSRRNFTFTAIKIISEIFSFSVLKDGVRSVCTRTIGLFKRDLNISESSIRRAIKAGDADGIITHPEGRKNAYQFDIENNFICGGHYRLEAWMTRPILLNGELVTLSEAEQIVAAFFNSECNRAPQECSARDIADKLDMSLPAAQQAIAKLIAFKLVFRPQKGVNGYKKSIYIINRKQFRELNRAEAKKQKAIEKAKEAEAGKQSESEQTAAKRRNATIKHELLERENYRAESASAALARAMADEEFRTSDAELKKLAPKLALSQLRNLPDLAKLQRTAGELEECRSAALKRLKISEAEFSKDFYIRCDKCRDKLLLADGSVCTCFARGAPPGKK